MRFAVKWKSFASFHESGVAIVAVFSAYRRNPDEYFLMTNLLCNSSMSCLRRALKPCCACRSFHFNLIRKLRNCKSNDLGIARFILVNFYKERSITTSLPPFSCSAIWKFAFIFRKFTEATFWMFLATCQLPFNSFRAVVLDFVSADAQNNAWHFCDLFDPVIPKSRSRDGCNFCTCMVGETYITYVILFMALYG